MVIPEAYYLQFHSENSAHLKMQYKLWLVFVIFIPENI